MSKLVTLEQAKNLKELGFSTHSLAESALLDALIEYEVKRIEFNNNRIDQD